jgi:NAD(P)-dependent dehydrogenase (short-subunit alcohol dehydrogenase family)
MVPHSSAHWWCQWNSTFGEPNEIAECAAWLLSPYASFMNGAEVAVDGGYLSI